MKVREGLVKFISPDTPAEERLGAARCVEPPDGPLPPNDRLTVLFVLSHDPDGEVAAEAQRNFAKYPVEFVIEAMGEKLDPLVLKRIIELYGNIDEVLAAAAANPGADAALLERLALTGPAEVVSILAKDPGRLAGQPSIMEAIRKNPNATEEILRSLDQGRPGAHGAEHHKGPMVTGDPDDELNLYQRVQAMTVAEKIKLALTGGKAARELLLKDANKMISTAVLKNPRITEDEVARIANSKSTPDDIIREISRHKEWLKNNTIRLGMVMNPKTPVPISIKLLDQLNDKDLVKIAKSRNIPNVLASNARRKLDRKKR
jgi:hypothetical protein